MTLKEIINHIEYLAAQIPNVGFIGCGDIYELNANQDISYPSVIITQREHMFDVNEQYTDINLVLFYVDRLLEDKSNEIDIQSYAMTVIQQLCTDLESLGVVVSQNTTFDVFTEKFQSLCGGAYANITFRIPLDECGWESVFDYLVKLFKLEVDNKQDKLLGGEYIKISGNEISISGLSDDISTISGDVSTLKNNVKDISAQTISNTHDISKHENKINTLIGDNVTNKENISANTEDIKSLSGKVNTNTNNISTLSGNVITNTHDMSIMSAHVSDISAQTISNSNNIGTLTDKTNSNLTKINNLSGTVSTHTTSISANTKDIATLKSKTSVNTSNIALISGEVESISETVSTLSEGLETLNRGIVGLTDDVEELSGKVKTNSSNISTLSAKEQSDIEALSGAIITNRNNLSAFSASTTEDIGSLTTDLNKTTTGLTLLQEIENKHYTEIYDIATKNKENIAIQAQKEQNDYNYLEGKINSASSKTESVEDMVYDNLNKINTLSGDVKDLHDAVDLIDDNYAKKTDVSDAIKNQKFKTVNGHVITGEGDITIEVTGVTEYSGGTNIKIEDHIISVTGINIPTKVSAFENDANYLTEHQSLSAYSTSADIAATYQVKGDYALKSDIPTVPTKVSAFENDANYLTEHQSLSAYSTSDEIASTYQVKGDYALKSEIPTKVSELENDKGYISGYTETDPIYTADKPNIAFKNDIKEYSGSTHITVEDYVISTDLTPYDDTSLTNRVTTIEEQLEGLDEILQSI